MSGSAGSTSPHGISLPPALLGIVCFLIGVLALFWPWFLGFLYGKLIPIGLLFIGAIFLLIAFRSRPRPRPDLPPLGAGFEPPKSGSV